MNRWGTYQHSSTSLLYCIFRQNPALMHEQQLLARQEALQHASVGNFIGSSIDGSSSGSGSGSGFIRCVYTAKNLANTSVTLLCDTKAGCCEKGCCPQDLFWYIVLFIYLLAII
ncbi:unnamed protein product [Thelazia callipaeda]|uniref:CX domain-containing protein n=1 Tax=Thelazia callipaeda TaxID=103827 RepID=A0A0N5CP96_THECL|nr:unnamed protein product [Thelazia callipaeda]